MQASSVRKGKKPAKKGGSDSGRKREGSGKGQGSLEWVPLFANAVSCWVLGPHGAKSAEISGGVRTPETAILLGSLYARVVSSATMELS